MQIFILPFIIVRERSNVGEWRERRASVRSDWPSVTAGMNFFYTTLCCIGAAVTVGKPVNTITNIAG